MARTLNPDLNMWVTAEPVVRDWIERKLGPVGQIEGAVEGAASLGRLVTALPDMLDEAQTATHMLADMAQFGRHQARPRDDRGTGDGPGAACAARPLCAWWQAPSP